MARLSALSPLYIRITWLNALLKPSGIFCLTLAAFCSEISAGAEVPLENPGFEEFDDTGTVRGWQVNPDYPCQMEQVAEENTPEGEHFVRLTSSGTTAGLQYAQPFPKQATRYKIRYSCRGQGKISVGFSLWGDSQWLSALCHAPVEISSAETWTPMEEILEIPEVVTSRREDGQGEESSVAKLVPVIFLTGANCDIDGFSIEEEP